MSKDKFKFNSHFQESILRYIIKDTQGYKVIPLIKDYFFSLIEHSFIFMCLENYYNEKGRIPSLPIFLEIIEDSFVYKDYINNLTELDRDNIRDLTKDLYKQPPKDGDEILEKIEKFSQYVELKTVIQEVDLRNFSQYEKFSNKVSKAIAPKIKKVFESGSFLIKDMKTRQFERQDRSVIEPTPFRQLNKLTNAGGFNRGSIAVILDKEKKFKTGMLVNIVRNYLKLGKKILVIDNDNTDGDFMIRLEQSIAKKSKSDILSGEYDKKIQKTLRHYRRISGGEVIIKPSLSLVDTANDIDRYLNYLYKEFNIRIEVLVIDYLGKMGCISGKKDDNDRISEAYIDVGNLAKKHEITHIWTAHHVTRKTDKREQTVYKTSDIAKCIDIVRHAHVIYGLNRSPKEEGMNFQRLEIIRQRDGVPRGRAVFSIDQVTQRLEELTSSQLRNYREEFGRDFFKSIEEEYEEDNEEKKKSVDDI